MTGAGSRIALAMLLAGSASSVAHTSPGAALPAQSIAPAARPAATVVDAFHAALERGDTKAAAALLSEDVLIFEAGGAERSKVEYMAEHLAADAEFAKATIAKVESRRGRVAGPVAWIASEGRTTGVFRGRQVNSRTTETMVLVHAGNSWKIAHIHWSSAPVR